MTFCVVVVDSRITTCAYKVIEPFSIAVCFTRKICRLTVCRLFPSLAHSGNKRFRDIVALHRPDYVRAPKIQKPSVARVIVRAIRHGDPVGRFLKKDEKTGKWVDVGDKKAAEKTSQALREKTNEERDKQKSSTTLGSGVLLPAPSSYLAAGSFLGIMPSAVAPMAAAAAAAAGGEGETAGGASGETGEKATEDGKEEQGEEANNDEGKSEAAASETEAKTADLEQTEEV